MGPYYYRESIYCPDVSDGSGGGYNHIDNRVDLTDKLEVIGRFGDPNTWFDVSGDEVTDMTDALITIQEFGQTCYPL